MRKGGKVVAKKRWKSSKNFKKGSESKSEKQIDQEPKVEKLYTGKGGKFVYWKKWKSC